ncbi:MAG: hypothetical protein H7842_01230 [Gammaproteobacteria bacterium SHHR-1]|uniref:hypothetical protein n=1 Tax=Magnetovirga frankeli TaxID=947516 RepID=UPI0012932995|nr:hypothetical protein D5125_09150 [gamma proteobacterium SS-5]
MIQLAVKGKLEHTLARVERAVLDQGGQFQGDSRAGTFSGKTPLGEVQGEYRVSDGQICIRILRKPSMVPLGMIEKQIRAFFAEQKAT